MANTILIKNKTTAGAPQASQLAVNEMCWVTPEKQMYIRDVDGVRPLGGSIADTYETVSQNLAARNATETITDGNITSKVYDLGEEQSITKTINYLPNGDVDSIVLSGDIPPNIATTKTLVYNPDGSINTIYS